MEIIVQDGASDDGTLETLKSYDDERIVLVSEPDINLAEAFHKAIKRCSGDILVACLGDEELLPGAITAAITILQNNTTLDVIYGDMLITDLQGKVKGKMKSSEWDYRKNICSEFAPYFSSAFFKRHCLIDTDFYSIDAKMYQGYADWCIWWRVGRKYKLKYFNRTFSKYSVHEAQVSAIKETYLQHQPIRLKIIDEILSDKQTPLGLRKLKDRAIAGVYLHNADAFIRMGDLLAAKEHIKYALCYEPNKAILGVLINKICMNGIEIKDLFTGLRRVIRKVESLILKIKLAKSTNIAIYGASDAGKWAYYNCLKNGKKITVFFDGNKHLNNTEINGIKIIYIDELKNMEDLDTVIVTSKTSQKEMKAKLRELRYRKKVVTFLI